MRRRAFLTTIAAPAPVIALAACGTIPVEPPAPSGDAARFRAAIVAGDLETAARLLAGDAALLFARDEQDRTPYRLAQLNRRAAVADWLLAQGYRRDIFDIAAAGDVPAFTDAFTADPSVLGQRDRFGFTPLHAAVEAGRVPTVEAMAGRGAVIDARPPGDDKAGRPPGPTPLLLALSTLRPGPERTDIVLVLLGQGADPSLAGADGVTPLALARDDADLTRALLRRGAEPPSPAVPRDDRSTRYLARSGTPVARDDNHGIPQSWVNQFVVFAHFKLDKVTELLGRCPDLLNTRATWDELAVEGAAHIGFRDCALLLLDRGAPLSICTAAMLGEATSVRCLLRDHPAAVRTRGPHDFPLAFYPAFGGVNVEMAELLEAAGVDMAAEVRGATALHNAAFRGQTELVHWLLQRGLRPDQLSRSAVLPGTPLEIARRRGHKAVEALLTKA